MDKLDQILELVKETNEVVKALHAGQTYLIAKVDQLEHEVAQVRGELKSVHSAVMELNTDVSQLK